VEVLISIGTSNDEHRKILEPGSSSIQERLNVLDQLKDNRFIKTSVFFGPIYPSMNWEEIKRLLDTYIEKNVSSILIDTLHLKPGLQEFLLPRLKKDDELMDAFQHNVFSSTTWYEEITKKIKRCVKEKSEETVIHDAF